MKKSKGYTFAALGAAVIVLIIMILFTPNRCGLLVDKTVEIPQGTSIIKIAEILEDNNVISGKISFIARTVISGKKNKLKYGTFTFPPEASYTKVIDILCNEGAKRETVSITIPEGYSVEMIIEKLVSSGLGTKEDYDIALDASYDFEFLNYIGENGKIKLQGFLFPSTYEFYADESAENIIKTMLAEFEKQYLTLGVGYENLGEIIKKASLIEREAKLDSERKIIAGVIENRLKADMRLQIDASVVYAISDGLYNVERVLYSDLDVDSAYNTYRNIGLPVGAICNPGISSIEAAISPDTHDWLYYRVDTTKNDGSHTFSTSFEEHKQ